MDKNIFIINAHQHFTEGRLNQSLVEKMTSHFAEKGYQVKTTSMEEAYDIEEELEKHRWADAIIIQSPVNWMGFPWSFKKYMDEVYTAGTSGELCNGDGRTSKDPKRNYGSGGALKGKKYMLSLTFNAPVEAFDALGEYLFQGKSIDDLFYPTHMNFRFFGMQPIKTFACHDVIKNPEIEKDFIRLENHLNDQF
ncbi:MAG: flavodoxin family protein [Gammaproteobacteria bacterium]|nr:MAG: flavodoxin family protein [Gammaproteobacteria bacterium]